MSTEYHILKRGLLRGPYPEEEVVRQLQAGELTDDDLGQTAQSYYWMPLHKLLGAHFGVTDGPSQAPAFGAFMQDIKERLWISFLHYPLESGLMYLGIGLIVAVFTFWPVLLYGPCMLASLTAGAMLFLRGRTVAGVALCAAAILLPILIVLVMQ